MGADLDQEHVPDLGLVLLADITTADAAAQGPTALAHVHARTVAVRRLVVISPHPSSPTLNQRPATTATVTPSRVDATVTAAGEVLATKGSARVLGHDPAPQSKQTGTVSESGTVRETETAPPLTSHQRNTNTRGELVTEETGGRGRDLDPTTGTERGSVATRANTTAVVGTQDIAGIGAETLTHMKTGSGTDGQPVNSKYFQL